MRKTIQNLIAVFLLLGIVADLHAASLTLKITQWVEDAYPIAVVPFGFEGKTPPSEDIAAIVTNDLLRSGKFNPLPVTDMLNKPSNEADIKFKNWRILGSESLVIGQVKQTGADNYKITFWLFDVFKAKRLEAGSVPATGASLRAAAHAIADIIYKKLLNEPGAFSTLISYVTAERKGKNNEYILWKADSDGENPQEILKSEYPIMSPSWSPDGESIAYASLEPLSTGEGAGKQKVFIQQWRKGNRDIVNTVKDGLYGAPSWSPDGKYLAFTIGKDGNTDIYRLDLKSKKLKKLTKHWAIDTEPVWTKDGKSIIFSADRSGRPQLYQASAGGGSVKRLTFDGLENLKAAISPDGKSIAMVHNQDGEYKIALMDLESGNFSVLTNGVYDESPSFAPNGSMIIYATTEGQQGTLATVSTDGRFRQSLAYQGDVREPAWSPLNVK